MTPMGIEFPTRKGPKIVGGGPGGAPQIDPVGTRGDPKTHNLAPQKEIGEKKLARGKRFVKK